MEPFWVGICGCGSMRVSKCEGVYFEIVQGSRAVGVRCVCVCVRHCVSVFCICVFEGTAQMRHCVWVAITTFTNASQMS